MNINIRNTLSYIPRRNNRRKKSDIKALALLNPIVPNQIIYQNSYYKGNEVDKIMEEMKELKNVLEKEKLKILVKPTVSNQESTENQSLLQEIKENDIKIK